jgi:hypothetical protein
MKKLIAFLAAFALVAQVQPAYAADAYNAEMTPMAEKSAMFLIGEDSSSLHFSTLTASGKAKADGSAAQWTCDSVDDPACSSSKAEYIGAESVLPVCDDKRTDHCVESLELSNKDGVLEKATFTRNPGGMNFPASSKFGFYGGTTPSLWEAPFSPSASGTTSYVVIVRARQFMNWDEKKFKTEAVVASVIPYRETTGNFKAPYQMTVESNHRGERGIGLGGHGYECAWNEEGKCGVIQDFAPGVRVKLSIRISDEIGGWFKGRIKNPVIAVNKKSSSSNLIQVEAEPALVPKMVYQTPITGLSAWERNFAMKGGMAGGWDSGFITWSASNDTRTFSYLENFRNKIKDEASGSNTYWSFGTVKSGDRNSCLGDTSKVLGIVTTNSMVYDGGVPKFSGGFLNYKVAGLHYAPVGKDLNLGSYDLVMRSDTARCLYGFSKAPLSATVSVTNEKGAKTTATTVVSEKNGWLKMAAYGFTFSKKTIKVKISKKKK